MPMKEMNLRIADLRKKKKMTQKELADAMGVSFQTISKWEKGVNLPDITILPALAEYFKVSIDQLMGVVPLQGEEYIEEKLFSNPKMELSKEEFEAIAADIAKRVK